MARENTTPAALYEEPCGTPQQGDYVYHQCSAAKGLPTTGRTLPLPHFMSNSSVARDRGPMCATGAAQAPGPYQCGQPLPVSLWRPTVPRDRGIASISSVAGGSDD